MEMTRIATGFSFTEGPLYFEENDTLLFSDTPANILYRWYHNERVEVFQCNSGLAEGATRDGLSDMVGSNGLAKDINTGIYVCEHGNHAIGYIGSDGLRQALKSYNGKPFNSPNDICISGKGVIYFTDPPYGLKDGRLQPERFQPYAGVYKWEKEEVMLVNRHLQYPNGICFSSNEDFLYVSSMFSGQQFVLRFPVENDGLLGLPEIWLYVGADGIACGPNDELFLCTSDGIKVFNNKRALISTIKVPEPPSNLCLDLQRQRIFITARSSVYMTGYYF